MTLPPIFVVSLARAAKRRENMRARLDALDAEYEIIDAVDGATADFAPYHRRLRQDIMRRKFARELTPAEIGCYLSHYNLWERLVTDDISCAIVLEDDASLNDDFVPVVADVLALDFRWDVVHLAAHRPELVDAAFRGLAGRENVFGRYKRRLHNAHAYLITRAGARKLLNICREISEPVDCAWGRWWHTGIVYYCVAPPLAGQEWQDSMIAPGGYGDLPKGKLMDRIAAKIWRRKERVLCRFVGLVNPVPKVKRKGT